MKKYAAALLALTIFCFNVNSSFAQSRRVPPAPANGGKMNKREPQAEPSPTPVSSASAAENSSEPAAEIDEEIVKIDTDLVSIPVKVSDRKGRFIAGLSKEDFQVFEENAPQEIAYFSDEEQPFTVALVLDMGYSTTFKIAEIQTAAIAFITQLRPTDKIMVVSFDGEVHMLAEATGDRQVLQRAIRGTRVESGTSLYDAVDLVINSRMRKINGRKAIVLFTDGVDTTSRRANDLNNLGDALELDALVYPIRYDTFANVQAMKNKPVIVPPTVPKQQPGSIPSRNPFPFPFPVPTTGGGSTPSSAGTTTEDYKRAEEYLNEMASRTGGRVYQASNTGNLAAAFSDIAGELRQYYSLGYYPKENAKTGKTRKIKVRVNRNDAVVRARSSYVVKKVKIEK